MSCVVVVKIQGVDLSFGLDKNHYRLMLEAGLTLLNGADEVGQAVSRLLPRGSVTMKANCLARKLNSTPVALSDALSELLVTSGIDENNIIIWDRTNRELREAGYTLNASFSGRRCLGSDSQGVGYSRDFYTSGEVNSLVTQILIESADNSINLPVLKDHSLAGMSAGLKNMYGAIHNPNKYHDNNCSPFCAHVNNLEPIRSKHRLTVLDAVRVQFNGGPGYMAAYVEEYGGVIMSDDPVACDRVGLEIIEHLRHKYRLPSLEQARRPVKYLQPAAELGLGEADLSRIDLRVLSMNSSGNVHDGELLG
jgi:hypothetical protein